MNKLQQVEKLIEQGRYQQAEAAFVTLVKDPQYRTQALGTRAWFLLNQGRYEDAVADYDQLILENPQDLHAKGLLSQAYFRMGMFKPAMEMAINALQANPLDSNAVETMRQCQEALGMKPDSHVKRDLGPLEQLLPPQPGLNHVVTAIEEDPQSHPTSISPAVDRTLYCLVRLLRPELVVETGSYIGYSACCIGQALEDNGQGMLHAFDMFDDTEKYESPAVGLCKNRLEGCRKHLEAAGLGHRVIFHQGDSSTNIKETFKDREPCLDMAFVDGDHTLEGCAEDWWAVDASLKDGGGCHCARH